MTMAAKGKAAIKLQLRAARFALKKALMNPHISDLDRDRAYKIYQEVMKLYRKIAGRV